MVAERTLKNAEAKESINLMRFREVLRTPK